ncbi:MAG: type II secretion system F family protein [Candidatus Binatia bacterium]|nr:type II secretion system F family protein [Candidatus Binatia bacterium]MDG1959216.1 type II secretion system F family protein [Candidatus Binatia bacterium]MDG2011840.1 type II secretion system F family protein [Candidatus Binatia bacterium]
MAQFQYRATDADGKVLEGMIDASDRTAAAARLQDRGLMPLRVAEPGPERTGLGNISLPTISFKRGIKTADLLVFTHELSTLLTAGLPLDRSLQILSELSESEEMKRVTGEVLTEVQRGKSLAEALNEHPDVFESLYVNMVKAGEIGGVLDQVLERLTEYLESATELRDEVRSAMVYPTILLLTSFGSVAILLVYVLPQFSTVFAQSGAALPTSAAILMGASEILRSYWWLGLLLVGGTAFGFAQWIGTEDGRVTWDRTKLRLVLVGELTRKVAVSRFARTLGTLLRSGVPMLQALDIVRNVAGNVVLAAAIDEVKVGVRGGDGVAGPLSQSGVFPQLALQMISVGEETGRLDEMLITVADYFDKEVRAAVTQMTNMLEPLLLVVGGLVVGFIVVAMFSAIFSVNNMPL